MADSFEDLTQEQQDSFMADIYANCDNIPVNEETRISYKISVKTLMTLAKRGLTVEQMADCCGMSVDNFEAYISIDEDLEQAIRSGRAQGVSEILGSLYRAGCRGNQEAIKLFLKNCAGWEDGPQGRKQPKRFKSDNFEEEMKRATEALYK